MNRVERIIDYTARTEGGGRYDAWNPNDNGAGVSFGLIQFNQAGGRLLTTPGSSMATLFQKMKTASPTKFVQIFGDYADDLVNVAWVKAANLNDPNIKQRIIASAKEPEFQAVQRQMAKSGYFDPAAKALAAFGIKSERAHAMAFDASVQWGPQRATKFLGQALEESRQKHGKVVEKDVLQRFASKADSGSGTTRRAKILADSNLSDDPIVQGSFLGVAILLGLVWWYYKE